MYVCMYLFMYVCMHVLTVHRPIVPFLLLMKLH